ncbi:unnamed protein product [Amoebophrya sp. A25]|nr:unnamed protein product [Amoebophrya sp. A25]|eukprot:GSA25T00025457001.1
MTSPHLCEQEKEFPRKRVCFSYRNRKRAAWGNNRLWVQPDLPPWCEPPMGEGEIRKADFPSSDVQDEEVALELRLCYRINMALTNTKFPTTTRAGSSSSSSSSSFSSTTSTTELQREGERQQEDITTNTGGAGEVVPIPTTEAEEQHPQQQVEDHDRQQVQADDLGMISHLHI